MTSPASRLPLTILHTDSSIGWGGQEHRTFREALILSPLGHRLCFAAPPEANLIDRARDTGFEAFPIPMKNGFDFGAIWRLKKLIDEIRPDIMNTHSGHDTILAGIAARLSAHRPLIIRTRHLILPITSRLTYSILPDHLLVTSDATKASLIEQGVDEKKITVVPSGFDETHFDPAIQPKDKLRKELGVSDGIPLIGTVAVLRTKKGHRYLVDAAPTVLRAFPDALFVLVGDGLEFDLEGLVRSRGLSNHFRLLGRRHDVAEILPSFDMMVLPTLEEAFGNALVEAQAMRVPVVGTRVGGVPQAVDDGKSGLLVPPADSDALASAIVELLRDPDRRRRMGEAGRAFVCRRFTMKAMGDKLLELYYRLLDERR